MTLMIRDLIGGEDAITAEAGDQVHAAIEPKLAQGQQIEVDFAGVTTFASLFFNAAIGRLLAKHAADRLRELLVIRNLPAAGETVLRRVIDNAKRYYSEPNYRQAQERVLASLASAK
jgi:hypothetical protein